MIPHKEKSFCGIQLRSFCFMIGYLNLVSSVLDIVFHLLTVAIVTEGFQCDVNNDSFNAIPWALVEPILLVLNLGTHGFYPFPGIFRRQYNMYVEHTSVTAIPKCYPGMIHVYLVDILNFLINLIWLRIVVSYIGALHKKNPDPMRMFFSLSIVKIVMQVMYFGYQPHFSDMIAAETYWFLKILDILIAIMFLVIVHKYTKALRLQNAEDTIEKPPSYIECLITASLQGVSARYGADKEKKDEVTTIDEKRLNIESQKASEETPDNFGK